MVSKFSNYFFKSNTLNTNVIQIKTYLDRLDDLRYLSLECISVVIHNASVLISLMTTFNIYVTLHKAMEQYERAIKNLQTARSEHVAAAQLIITAGI